MRKTRRLTIVVLCLVIAGFSALLAQPYLTNRITAIKANESGKIEILVTSSQAGEFDSVSPEPPAQFTLKENGQVQQSLRVETLPPAGEVSRTVILADLSRSLSKRQFADFKRAAADFVAKLKPGDLVALVTFHRRVYRELNFTSDRDLLKRRIAALKQNGNRTMLYDALVEAHKMLRDQSPRKAIVLYTDGKENASRVRIGDLTELFTSQPVPLFVAGKRKSFALKRLIRLARISGGDAFRADDRHDLAKLFHYLSRLRSQDYRLTYATQQKPGSTVDIEIEAPHTASPLVRSYTIPQAATLAAAAMPATAQEKLFSAALPAVIRMHMPEILLSLIVLLLVAVIIMLFFRKQEISVKVENLNPPAVITNEALLPLTEKKYETSRAKLPLDYHHGWLAEKEGPHTGRKYRINWHSITLGFADDNSIVIDDNTISPRHAKIERQGNKFVLFDLLSENGTWLNGKKLLRPKELNDFDEIGLGRTRLIFRKSAGIHDKKNGESD